MSTPSLFLVEDDPLILEDLKVTIEELGYEVLSTAPDAESCLEQLNELTPDLLILDIDLGGDMDGIDLARQINHTFKLPFIFLTAFYDQSTIARARSTEPSGYIVKPWNDHSLKATIELALFKQKEDEKEVQSSPESFFVKQSNEYISLKPDEITFAKSYDNYTYIYTDTDKYLISHTLKSVEEKLSPSGFARVHKSYLVNISRIESISEGFIYLNNEEIPLGRTYKQELLQQLQIL